MVTLYLIIRLFEFYTPALQFNLHQWQTVYKNGHIVTALLTTLYRDLIGNLKFILTPLLPIQKFHPNTLSICRVKRIKVAEFFRLFKPRAALEVNEYLFKLLICKFSTAMFC